jgi:signal peptidase I
MNFRKIGLTALLLLRAINSHRIGFTALITLLATVLMPSTASFLALFPSRAAFSQPATNLSDAFEVRYIPSDSMSPTLKPGDNLLIDKSIYRFQSPKRGHLIMFKATEQLLEHGFPSDSIWIKRVIGLPGEIVEVREEKVYINNQPLEESYIAEKIDYILGSIKVPANSYFVLGDNRNNSLDSHITYMFGFVPKELIIGQAIRIFWPPSRQRELDYTRELPKIEELPLSTGYLLLMFTNLGDYAIAINYFQQRLAIAQESKDRQSQIMPLLNLTSAYSIIGDYVKTIEYAQQLLTVARENQNLEAEAIALAGLGKSYLTIGDYPQGIEYSQKLLAILPETKDIRFRKVIELETYSLLGVVYLSLSDYDKAIEYSQKLLAITPVTDNQKKYKYLVEANAYFILGYTHFLRRDYDKSSNYFYRMIQLVDREETITVGAITLKRVDTTTVNKQIKALALFGQGINLLAKGNFIAAEGNLIDAIKLQESIRNELGNKDSNNIFKVSVFETQHYDYMALQQALIAQNKTNAALEISERGRARAFVELLAKRLSPQSDAAPPIQHPSLDDIKKIAQQQNATLVEYSIVNFRNVEKSELFVWVISPNGKVTFRQVDLTSLAARVTTEISPLYKLVAQTLESLGVGEDRNGIFEVSITNPVADPQRQTKSLKQLHQLLIQPIADLLPTDPEERVIFIPHLDLFRVPFPALMDSDGKYLVEKQTILTAPSIQVLELTHKARQNGSRSGQGVLVVGNPSPMPKGFQPLKGAEKEALDVAQLLKTKPLIGSQATEPTVLQQLPNARIIHLATHATFNEQQPLLGGVALAQTGKDTQNDGLLTAEEIFNLKSKLSAELLVLSACDTGRGRITGDGVIGLSRSFIAAGVPSVLVSLWSVPDAPTASLMTEFYTNLYQKKLDKAQALRTAMLKMMEKHRDNPRSWAAFTLIGEAE